MSTTTHGADARPLAITVNWSQIWDRVAAELGDRVAISSPSVSRTYTELEDRARRIASSLHRQGIGAGDAIGIFLYNRAEYLETIYAAFKLGAIPVNMNFRYRSEELADLIRVSQARAIVFPGSLSTVVAGALELRAGAEPAPVLLQVDDDGSPTLPVAHPFESVAAAEPTDALPTPTGDDEIYLFTGGTTGMPKAVVWRHAQLLDAQMVSLYGAMGIDFPSSLDEILAIAAHPEIPSPVTLPITPLMHAMAMFNSMNTLTLGGTVHFLDSARFDAARALNTIAEAGVTRLIIAGNAVAAPIVEELDRATEAGSPYDVSRLELIMSSGMLWSDSSKADLLRHLDAQLFDIVGSSEGGPYAYSSVWSPNDLPSALRLAANAVVLDENGAELDPESGAVGILAYKGPMPLGYVRDPEKTAEVYRVFNGVRYVMPGDWVRLLGGGRIEFLGRGSNVVNTGGEKVYPAEVEQQLLSHDEVVDCAVFGVDDARWGQIVAAVVELTTDSTLTVDDLSVFLGNQLAGYKKPRRIILVESMGRSPSGKLDLRALTALATDHTPEPPNKGH